MSLRLTNGLLLACSTIFAVWLSIVPASHQTLSLPGWNYGCDSSHTTTKMQLNVPGIDGTPLRYTAFPNAVQKTDKLNSGCILDSTAVRTYILGVADPAVVPPSPDHGFVALCSGEGVISFVPPAEGAPSMPVTTVYLYAADTLKCDTIRDTLEAKLNDFVARSGKPTLPGRR